MTQSKYAANPSGSLTGFLDTSYAPKGGRTSMWSSYYKNARYYQEQNFYSVAAELNSRFLDGKLNNTLRATYSHQYDPRTQEGGYFPGVDMVVGEGGNRAIYTVFGSETFSYGNLRDVHTVWPPTSSPSAPAFTTSSSSSTTTPPTVTRPRAALLMCSSTPPNRLFTLLS